MSEWFTQWFGEEYLALYPHRDAAEARQLVQLIGRSVAWGPGSRVLDIACGPGRHAAALEAEGIIPVGLDLSMPLLRRARTVSSAPFLRADLRHLPIRDRAVDVALSLFTSFGYFDTDAEHASALAGMARTVRAGGWFVLDFLNADMVRESVKASRSEVSGERDTQVRRYLSDDMRYVIKEIRLADAREFTERVRLFGVDELLALLRAAGVEVRFQFGDYAGAPVSERCPRVLLLGQVA
jgi:SAM-dependent methyltransferase